MGALKIFISYSSVDRREAFQLLQIVRASGVDAWLDFFDIKPARLLREELTSALDSANVACILLTPSSVASKWVRYEINYARERTPHGLILLPIIVRPCQIPDILEDVVGLDASDGLDDETVRIRITRAITGDAKMTEGTLLSEAERARFAREQVEEEVKQRLPQLHLSLEPVREEPIRNISITVDQNTFPNEKDFYVELQLVLNTLWSAPMRWYFARYHEGTTWPPSTDFNEPPYTNFYLGCRPPIDCKFRWYDRCQDPVSSIDGTDGRSMLASFSIQFDGNVFQPSQSLEIAQTYQIPNFKRLVTDGSHFQLLIHRNGETELCVDPETSEIDLVVTALFRDQQPGEVTLYATSHNVRDRVVINAPALRTNTNAIERQVLARLFRPVEASSSANYDELVQAVSEQKPIEAADVRLAAQLAVSRASYYAIRRRFRDAAQLTLNATQILSSMVMSDFPIVADGILMYQACNQTLDYFSQASEPSKALKCAFAPVVVAQRLVECYPEEPDFKRMSVTALLGLGGIQLNVGEVDMGIRHLIEAVEISIRLVDDQPTPLRLSDGRKTYADVLYMAAQKDLEARLPIENWKAKFDPEQRIESAIQSIIQSKAIGPRWMVPASLESWSTFIYHSPSLHYKIPIPQQWNKDPSVTGDAHTLCHVFAGPNPVTFLSIRFMDKADANSDLKMWVGTTMIFTGLPIVELTGNEALKLLDWHCEDNTEAVVQRFLLDEAHCWTGVLQIGDEGPSLRRIYVACLRRATFAWLISMTFDTPCVREIPEEIVYWSDHVKAAATIGRVELG